jgi:sortase A
MRFIVKILGGVSIALGLVLCLLCAYLMWGTDSYTEHRQRILQQELSREHAPTKPGEIDFGSALAMIRIPLFGRRYHYAVVEGVDDRSLREGPGHYPGSAMPGEIGNLVIAGHRTTYGAPFGRLDELHRGDAIVIDTRDARYTYTVTSKRVVRPSQVDVIASVPGNPGIRPTQALITLTTCHPRYSARQRLVVVGVLAAEEPRKHR